MFHHITVLKEEAVKGLNIKPDGIYVDCTLGGAGHSERIAEQLSDQGLLIALDQDETAIKHAAQRLAPYQDRIHLIKSNFRHLKQVLQNLDLPQKDGVPQVNGILFDLGVSSPQLDEAERGFSYNHDAPLDMRMDRHAKRTAYHVINEYDEQSLADVIFKYGEEKFSRRIAKEIIKARAERSIETTGELVEIIKRAIPAAARRTGPHPAKRTFQAIRIEVNEELNVFEEALHQSIECLAPGGRVSVITFHSLEDRICKQTFAQYNEPCSCPPGFPMCVCNRKQILRPIQRKPVLPSEQERIENPRSRSAKLRVAEKL